MTDYIRESATRPRENTAPAQHKTKFGANVGPLGGSSGRDLMGDVGMSIIEERDSRAATQVMDRRGS